MAFDVRRALQEGYSYSEIAEYLADKRKFNLAGARKEGYSDQEIIKYLTFEPTIGGQLKEAVKGIVPGAIGLVEQAAVGASALLPDQYEAGAQQAIRGVAAAAKKPFAPEAGYEETVGRKFGEAAGSFVPFLGLGALGVAGRVGAGALATGAGAGEALTRAQEEGAGESQKSLATGLGAVVGISELFAPFRILSRIPEGEVLTAANRIKRVALAGGEEAAQEAAAGLAQNLIARGVYKPEQQLIEGLGEQAAYGGAVGALAQGLLDVALGRRARTTPRDQQAEEFRRTLEEEALKTQELFAEKKTEEKPEEKAKKLKLEDLDQTKVANTLKYLEGYTLDPDKIKERNEREVLLNRLKGLDLPREQFKAFEKIDSNEKLLDAITKFLTPKPATKEEQGEQLDQLDKQTGGAGVDVSSQPGAATTTTGITSPSTGGVGSATDASQQVGVGAQQPDIALAQQQAPATQQGTPSVVTSPEAQQKEEARAEAPAQGTEVAGAIAAQTTKESTITKQIQEEFNKVDTLLREQETKLNLLKGQEYTPEYKETFDNVRYLANQRSNLGAQLSQIEDKQKAAKIEPTKTNTEKAKNVFKSVDDEIDSLFGEDEKFISFDPNTYYGITEKELNKFNSAIDIIRSGRIYNASEEKQQIVRNYVRGIQNKLKIAQERASDPAARLAQDIQLYDAAREVINEELADESEEERRAFGSSFDKLQQDEKQFFLDLLSNNPTIENAVEALKILQDYKTTRRGELKKQGLGEGARIDTILAYEANRRAESDGRGIVFPAWHQLTQEEKDAFTKQVPRITEGKEGPSGETIISGFDAIEQGIAQKQADIIKKQREVEATSRKIARRKIEQEADKSGFRTPLPDDVKQEVMSGKSNKLLKYLSESAEGPKNAGPFRAIISRMVARVLERFVSGTKIKYIPFNELQENNRPESFIASYDPKTDTVFVTDRGLNETALLHEFVHAATIKTIFKYLNGHRGELDAGQRLGVAAIIKMYNYLKYKTTLGKKYPTAFSNVYEFVSYGLTDPRLEKDLRQMKSASLAVYTDFIEGQELSKVILSPGTKTPEAIQGDVLFGGQELLEHIRNERKLGKEPIEVSFWQSFAKAVSDVIGLTHRYSRLILHKLSRVDARELKKAFDSAKQKDLIDKIEKEIQEADTFGDLVTENSEEVEIAFKKQTKKIDESLRKLRAKLTQGAEKGQTIDYEGLSTKEAQKQLNDLYKKNIFTNEEAAQIKNLESVIEINRLEADRERIAGDLGFVGPTMPLLTEADFTKVTTLEPGYLGNLFVELMSAFEAIAATPEATPEFRIQSLRQTRGETKKTPGAPVISEELLITDAEAKEEISKTNERLLTRLEASRPTVATKARALKDMFDKDGRTRIIELTQNYRYRLDRLNDTLRRLGKLISYGDKQTNAGTAVASSAGRAETIYQKEFYNDINDANDTLAKLSKAKRLSVQETLTHLHMYAIHLHDKERREIKYLREAPLADDNAVKERVRILNEILNVDRKALGEAKARDTINKLRGDLETLVSTNIDTTSKLSDKNDEVYNTLGPYSLKQIEAFGKTFEGDAKKIADDLIQKLQKIEKTTIETNKKANYFSPPVQNLVDFYNFDFYFPFKGRPDSGPTDYQIDYNNPSVGGELQDSQEAFDGRITDADNPILNVLNEASRSAMRLGRAEAGVTLSIKNLIDSKIISGKPVGKITFAERFNNKFTEGLRKGEKNIFHYLPDGTIEIYEINDRQMLEAIKRPLRDDNWFIDSVGKATSFFGQMHTRYNPAFAPMDFLRNLFTYAGVLGAETSGKRGLQVMSEMASILATNGFTKTAKYSLAFSRGNKAEMARLANLDPFYKDLNEYYELGGRVAYLQGITIKDNLTDAVNAADRNGIIKSLSGANKFFDAWLDMFEMSTRIAAYRTMRDQFVAEGMPIEQAKIEAVAYAKNLANFEKTGIKGKELGAFFMFFRPAATGAVRAYEALSPALDYFKSDEELKNIVKKEAEDVGKLTDADINKLVKEYRNRTKSAATVSATLFGVGAATFMMAAAMAGDDDEGRNKVLTDDTARWVRSARFNTGLQSGGKDIVLQLPWGFGPGAFASVGAQVAAFVSGSSSFGQFINNVLDAGAESFMPIPISKINKFEHPVEAALDSVLPSALKPLFEWAMNMDGLGREIYNNRQSRNNDAYTGGDNIPEFFKDAARLLYNMSDGKIDVSPNTMYFFANNYLDGVSRLASWSYNTAHTIAGNRDFDFKTDTLLLDAYLKAPSNYDARQYSEVAKEIKSMEQRYRAFTTSGDPERMSQYFQEHPYDKAVIDYYNKYNAKIDKLREMANVIRRDQSKTIKERQDEVRILVDSQNKMKSAFVQSIAAYGIEPD